MTGQEEKLTEISVKPRPVLKDITVVIPTLGRPILEESIYRIAAGTAWPGEVIVADQGSNRQVAGWIESFCLLGINAAHLRSSQSGRPYFTGLLPVIIAGVQKKRQ